ncbi:hypothetical protein [Bradyrhizobium sp. CCBAU 51753]|uniref:hypothetical protein n=1 Tax=Bradyrhizobium sp. CCBAU 51753 TaxID=1325100 RepID=UPI00188B82E8|nr:hypothetical protein [Bradyrhizobium sp. CCBAU 51753]QOZ23892.1 hypothetical protein XH93_09890 [Bradyrhizobium sp. CCBAU 51753]
MTKKPGCPRLGVVNLDGIGYPNTIDLPDPFGASPPSPDEPTGYLFHPHFWPFPIAQAIAPGTGGQILHDGKPEAIKAIADAVNRLAPHCDLIVGNCGYMYRARSAVRSETPTLLSALELLPYALEASTRPAGILTFDKELTEKMLADHPDLSRLRIVGVSDLPNWSALWHRDWYVKNPRVSTDELRRELIELCLREREVGAFTDIGSLVLECTAMPQFRADIVAAIRVPTWDIAAVAKSLLGA